MEYIYAQLNQENIVCGISSLSGEVVKDNMIRIDTFDNNLIGKLFSNGKFIEIVKEISNA